MRLDIGYARGRTLPVNHELTWLYVYDTIVQADGKLLVAANGPDADGIYRFALARFQTNGRPDLSFGNNGVVVSDPGVLNLLGQSVYDVALMPDGRIMTAGSGGLLLNTYPWVQEVPLVRRFLPDGQVDPSFGEGGAISLLQEPSARAISVSIEGDALFVGGHVVSDDAQQPGLIWKLTQSGATAAGFGQDGLAWLPGYWGSTMEPTSVTQLADGGLLVLGYYENAASWRLLPDGAADPAFGDNGYFMLPINGMSEVNTVVVDRNSGRFVAARALGGTTDTSDALQVLAFLPSGQPDLAYGTDGTRQFPLPGGLQSLNIIAYETTGAYVLMRPQPDPLTGQPVPGTTVVRVSFTSGVDRSFGRRGLVTFPQRLWDGGRLLRLPDGGLYVTYACTVQICGDRDVIRLLPVYRR